MLRFVANQDFYSPELQSQYVKGLGYTVRPQNTLLDRLVREQWLPSGKVSIVVSPTAKVEGTDKPRSLLERITSWL